MNTYSYDNRLASDERLYVAVRSGSPDLPAVKLYGPFATQADAVHAGLVLRPVQGWDSATDRKSYLLEIIETWEDSALRTAKHSPEELNVKSLTLRPASAVRQHSSWTALDRKYGEAAGYAARSILETADLNF